MNEDGNKQPLTPAQRRARADAKKRAAGLVPVLVWVPPENKPDIIALAADIKNRDI